MNEKIKWLGIYSKQELLVTDDDNRNFRSKISSVNYHYNSFEISEGWSFESEYEFDRVKLILKELKDISDEDLKELNCLISEFGGWSVYELSLSDILFYDKEIDFLRSKGYAVGIPKEYYVTKSELNN